MAVDITLVPCPVCKGPMVSPLFGGPCQIHIDLAAALAGEAPSTAIVVPDAATMADVDTALAQAEGGQDDPALPAPSTAPSDAAASGSDAAPTDGGGVGEDPAPVGQAAAAFDCVGVKADGSPCRNRPLAGSVYCRWHQSQADTPAEQGDPTP